MNPERVLECMRAIASGSDEQRAEAMAVLTEFSKSPELVGIIVNMGMNKSMSFANRTWCVYVCLNLKMEITDEMFSLLVTGLSETDEVFRNAVTKLLGRRVTSQARLNVVISLPDEVLEQKLMILCHMIEYSEVNGALAPVLMYMAEVLVSAASTASKVLAAEGLSLMLRGMDQDTDFTPYRPLLLTIYAWDISDETLPILITMYSAISILSPQDWYNVSIQHFVALAKMAPLPVSTSKYSPFEYCQILADGIFEVMKEYDTEVSYDINVLVQACVMNCLVADEVVADWNSSIEHFFVDNVSDDVDDCLSADLRRTCVFILNTYDAVPAVVSACKEMVHLSPRHQEAAYYILYNVLPSGTHMDIELGCPTEDPLTYGRYIICVAFFQMDIDPGIIESCLKAEGYILPVLASQAILESDRYDNFLVLAVQRLFTFVPQFETAILKDLFSLIQRLIQKDGSVFMPIVGEITQMIAKLFTQFVSEPEISLSLSSMIAVIAGLPECRSPVIGIFLPLAMEVLRHEETLETGFDLMIALFGPVDKLNVPREVFEIFMHAITHANPNELGFQSVFPTVAFFARNGYASALVKWYTTILQDSAIKGGQFKCMASVMIHLFKNCNDEEILSLLTAVVSRLQCSDPSHTIRSGLATSICAMVMIDKDRTVRILQTAGFRIEELVPEILDIFDVSCRSYLDRKVILVAMLMMKEVTARAYDSEMTLGELGARMVGKLVAWMNQDDKVSRCGLDEAEHQFALDGSEAIDQDDPFLKDNALVTVPFTTLLQNLSKGLPPDVLAIMEKAVSIV